MRCIRPLGPTAGRLVEFRDTLSFFEQPAEKLSRDFITGRFA